MEGVVIVVEGVVMTVKNELSVEGSGGKEGWQQM